MREKFLADLSPKELEFLRYDWSFWRRRQQVPPAGDWRYWLIKAGRGFGKTRCGAEWVRESVKSYEWVNMIGATTDDARDIMVQGESGVLAICPTRERPIYRKQDRKLLWPNGATSLIFTADEPDRLRGKQASRLWMDEIASWRYGEEAFSQAVLGLRLGSNPQAVITTTPRPIKIIKQLLADPHCVVTHGSTYDNRANLADAFFDAIIRRFEGTRMGRQELQAELLIDVDGALWNRAMIQTCQPLAGRDLKRIVVAIDPAVTSGEHADETGIIVAAVGVDGLFYVLDDLTCRLSPEGWATRAVNAYRHYKADRIVAEINNGGEMVASVIRNVDHHVSYKSVHASRGKRVRAEPIAALYEQKRVFHVGSFPALEDQQCNFVPDNMDGSPDRVDALVWALTELTEGGSSAPAGVIGQSRRRD